MVSTPYKPGDLFEHIDRDPTSIFKKLSFHYSVGMNNGGIMKRDESNEEIYNIFKLDVGPESSSLDIFWSQLLKKQKEKGIFGNVVDQALLNKLLVRKPFLRLFVLRSFAEKGTALMKSCPLVVFYYLFIVCPLA